jgi:hypothetical protein
VVLLESAPATRLFAVDSPVERVNRSTARTDAALLLLLLLTVVLSNMPPSSDGVVDLQA